MVVVVGVLVLFVTWAGSQTGSDAPVLEGEVKVTAELNKPEGFSGKLSLISWNIGYGRGIEGDLSGPWTREHIEKNLRGIAEAIRSSGADVALLQEVDHDAARSHGIDQAAYIADLLGWGYVASVTTWSNRYVPFPYWPPSRHYGAMGSGQCVLSRFPIESNVRYRLKQPEANPFWYNIFYLHRALQRVDVVVSEEKRIPIFNVHLEAFDVVNNRNHVKVLLEKMAEEKSPYLIVGGDFNALAPGAPKRFGFVDEPEIDFTGGNTMELFFGDGRMLDGLSEEENEAYMTFPADAPTRRLDYLSADQSGWKRVEGSIPSGVSTLSDHLPLRAVFQVVSAP